MFNIVLVEPEIPQNTGNIVRTCAATGARLHLIEPLGFEISDKYLRRAGLDYWHLCDIRIYKDMADFLSANNCKNCFFATTKARHRYDKVDYTDGCYIFFGKETKGLPEELLHDRYDECIRIPMKASTRSLNLSNSVAVVLFEALRQADFPDMTAEGYLTKF